MAWAALRARPRPQLISANPTPANGTRRMRRKQSSAETSESETREGATKRVTLLPLPAQDENGPRARGRATPPPCRRVRTRCADPPKAARQGRKPQSPILQPAIRNRRASYPSVPRTVALWDGHTGTIPPQPARLMRRGRTVQSNFLIVHRNGKHSTKPPFLLGWRDTCAYERPAQ